MSGFEFSDLAPEEQLACFRALVAMAAVDGQVVDAERTLIAATVERSGFPGGVERTIIPLMEEGPDMHVALVQLAESSAQVRFGVMAHLIDVVVADDRLDPAEITALDASRRALSVSVDQEQAINELVVKARAWRKADGPSATELEASTRTLLAFEVPDSVLWFLGIRGKDVQREVAPTRAQRRTLREQLGLPPSADESDEELDLELLGTRLLSVLHKRSYLSAYSVVVQLRRTWAGYRAVERGTLEKAVSALLWGRLWGQVEQNPETKWWRLVERPVLAEGTAECVADGLLADLARALREARET